MSAGAAILIDIEIVARLVLSLPVWLYAGRRRAEQVAVLSLRNSRRVVYD